VGCPDLAPLFLQTPIVGKGVHLELGTRARLGVHQHDAIARHLHTQYGRGGAQVDQVDVRAELSGQALLNLPTAHGVELVLDQQRDIKITIRASVSPRSRSKEVHGLCCNTRLLERLHNRFLVHHSGTVVSSESIVDALSGRDVAGMQVTPKVDHVGVTRSLGCRV